MPKVLGIKLTDSDYERWEDYAGKEPLAKFVRRVVECEMAEPRGKTVEIGQIMSSRLDYVAKRATPIKTEKKHPAKCSCFECMRSRKLK